MPLLLLISITLSIIAFISPAVSLLDTLVPSAHTCAVPSKPLSTVTTLPLIDVILTVSGFGLDAPNVNMLGALGKTDPSITFMLVAVAVMSSVNIVFGLLTWAGYISFSAIESPLYYLILLTILLLKLIVSIVTWSVVRTSAKLTCHGSPLSSIPLNIILLNSSKIDVGNA